MVKRRLMIALKNEEWDRLSKISDENKRTKSGQVAYWIKNDTKTAG